MRVAWARLSVFNSTVFIHNYTGSSTALLTRLRSRHFGLAFATVEEEQYRDRIDPRKFRWSTNQEREREIASSAVQRNVDFLTREFSKIEEIRS
jgi:hypothetical protein